MFHNRRQADELPQINMTPMVDVVLCLLIFFMAATRLYDWDDNEFTVRVPEVAEDALLYRECADRHYRLVQAVLPGRHHFRAGFWFLGRRTVDQLVLELLRAYDLRNVDRRIQQRRG